jgi:hypothetical protein
VVTAARKGPEALEDRLLMGGEANVFHQAESVFPASG